MNGLFHLVYVLKVHLHCSKYMYFLPFEGWLIFCCMTSTHIVYPVICHWTLGCFPVLATVTNAAINTVGEFVWQDLLHLVVGQWRPPKWHAHILIPGTWEYYLTLQRLGIRFLRRGPYPDYPGGPWMKLGGERQRLFWHKDTQEKTMWGQRQSWDWWSHGQARLAASSSWKRWGLDFALQPPEKAWLCWQPDLEICLPELWKITFLLC